MEIEELCRKYTVSRWTKEFKFPYEYTELYDLKEKLIKLLNEDVELIYSGE